MSNKLQTCPDCGKLISEGAIICPHCGAVGESLRSLGKFFEWSGLLVIAGGLVLLARICG